MAKRALNQAGASVQVVWMPGHTDSCWLNFTADLMADKAAMQCQVDGKGLRTLPVTIPMLKNHLKRHASLMLKHSWFHWHQNHLEVKKREPGHNYLENCVLGESFAVNWTLPELVRRELSEKKHRWLGVPREMVFASRSYQAAKAVTHMRLCLKTLNTAMAKKAKPPLPSPMCPWCEKETDSARHRFECDKLDPAREELAVQMYEAVYTDSAKIEAKQGFAMLPPSAAQKAEDGKRMLKNWDLVIKGEFTKNNIPESLLERFTAPSTLARRAIAEVVHVFLAKTRFYGRVFGSSADVLPLVRAKAKEADRERATARRERERAERASGPDSSPDSSQAPSDSDSDGRSDSSSDADCQEDFASWGDAFVGVHDDGRDPSFSAPPPASIAPSIQSLMPSQWSSPRGWDTRSREQRLQAAQGPAALRYYTRASAARGGGARQPSTP
jgi:hypothetical protein